MPEEEDPYMKNRDVAQKIANTYFFGAPLYGFGDGWSFMYPKFYGDSGFEIANDVMAMLAYQLGLDWYDRYTGKLVSSIDKMNRYMSELNEALEDSRKRERYSVDLILPGEEE